MRQLVSLARRYAFDVLIVIGALESALEIAFGATRRAPRTRSGSRCPRSPRVVLPLLARHRFPFAAPVGVLAARRRRSRSSTGGWSSARPASSSPAWPPRSCSAISATTCRRGWAWPSCSAARRSSSTTTRPTRRRVHLHPDPVRDRLARGLRAARAGRAGRGGGGARDARRAGARVGRPHRGRRGARADRARAPRHRRPRRQRDGAADRGRPAQAPRRRSRTSKEALEGVEQTGRTALAEMRHLLGAMRHDGDDLELAPQPGLDSLGPLLDEVRRAGLAVELQVDGEPHPAPAGARPLRVSHRAGGPDQRAQARARQPRGRDPPLPARRSADRGARRRQRRRAERRSRPRPRRRPRAGQDLRRRDVRRRRQPGADSS